MNRYLAQVFAILLTVFLVAGCGDDGDSDQVGDTDASEMINDTGDDGDVASDSVSDSDDDTEMTEDITPDVPEVFMPSFAELEDGVNILYPGGDTVCSRGTPYAFIVRKGDPSRVVVDFIGGGACWNAQTCSFAGAIFEETVEDAVEFAQSGSPAGFYNTENESNPFREWTHISIPYCTGDVHWGNATTTYGEGENEVTIEHKGAVNARRVLDWMGDNVVDPDKIFVTGCSAGSYGSVLWSPHVIDQYPDAEVYQFGDSGAGVITMDFFMNSFPSWNAQELFPSWIPTLNPEENDIFGLELGDLYIRLEGYYPEYQFSQYNTRLDNNQVFFYEAMGGQGGELGWSNQMLTSIEYIKANTERFRAFLPEETQHCILPYENFYTIEADGVLLVDWLDDMVNNQPIQNRSCEECSVMMP